MKTIADIFKTLTQEEREQHKDLINECLRRELENKKNSIKTKENIQKLADNMTRIIECINRVNEESQKAHLLLQKTDGMVH